MGKRIKKRTEKTVDLGYEKNFRIELPSSCGIKAGKLHGIGTRENQQDSFGISDISEEIIEEKGLLAVLADGMGGMADGEKASMEAVISCLDYFDTHGIEREIPKELREMIYTANRRVRDMLGGGVKQGGSTLSVVLVRKDVLHWISVGDSHIYLLSEGELLQLNEDHNYAVQLKEKLSKGEMTEDEVREHPQRKALTSYIGIEELKLIDQNREAALLKSEDRILLVSDGVYNTLTMDEILKSMEYPVEKAMIHMGMQIEGKGKANQDNYTAILLEIE